MSLYKAASIFNILYITLSRRMNKQRPCKELRVNTHKFNQIKKQTLVRYIIEQDARGFPLRLFGVEDMANLLLASRDAKPIGKP